MKVLVFLSLIALCFSQSTYVGRHVSILGDGTIGIVGEHGRETYLYKSLVDPRKLEVVLKTPYGPNRKIEIDETNTIHNVDFNTVDAAHYYAFHNLGSAYTQHDVLLHLFRPYVGMVDAIKYDQLMKMVHQFVQMGVFHQTVWDVLNNYEKYSPEYNHYSIGQYYGDVPYKYQQYSPEYYQKLSPLQRLHYLVQKYQYNQGHNEEYYPQQYLHQQYYPEYETSYGKYPYGKYEVNPWTKYYHQMNKYYTPYEYQYQTPSESQVYHQYPQYYQQSSWYPQQYSTYQKWWNPQQWYTSQKWWAPQEYSQYYKYAPQQWNSQYYGSYQQLPMVY